MTTTQQDTQGVAILLFDRDRKWGRGDAENTPKIAKATMRSIFLHAIMEGGNYGSGGGLIACVIHARMLNNSLLTAEQMLRTFSDRNAFSMT